VESVVNDENVVLFVMVMSMLLELLVVIVFEKLEMILMLFVFCVVVLKSVMFVVVNDGVVTNSVSVQVVVKSSSCFI